MQNITPRSDKPVRGFTLFALIYAIVCYPGFEYCGNLPTFTEVSYFYGDFLERPIIGEPNVRFDTTGQMWEYTQIKLRKTRV